jgi:SAM-dependent methyltransferase
MLRRWLAHPLTRGLDLDDPRTTQLRRRIIREKPFLHHVYEAWYAAVASAVPPGDGAVLELGSGAGFLKEWIPGLVTSDILPVPGVEVVLNGQRLPFDDGALRGIVMTNVFHHISEPRRFLEEATRCVRPGGVITMIEPWVTPWSRLVYTRLHHEPFDPSAANWEFPSTGPLSGANGAQAWILFARDRHQFEREFPEWRIASILPDMPLCYLLSGGVAMRALFPGWAFTPMRGAERLLRPWMQQLAMFAQITLVRAAG